MATFVMHGLEWPLVFIWMDILLSIRILVLVFLSLLVTSSARLKVFTSSLSALLALTTMFDAIGLP